MDNALFLVFLIPIRLINFCHFIVETYEIHHSTWFGSFLYDMKSEGLLFFKILKDGNVSFTISKMVFIYRNFFSLCTSKYILILHFGIISHTHTSD